MFAVSATPALVRANQGISAKPRGGARRAVVRCAGAINDNIKKDEAKVVDIVNSSEIEVGKKGVYCRCWVSGTFPLCDGSHMKHNKETGDNVGPLIVNQDK